MSVTEQLKEAIRGYGTVYRVAADTDVEQAALHRFMSGERGLHLSTVDKLCEFFGMKLTKPKRTEPAKRKKK